MIVYLSWLAFIINVSAVYLNIHKNKWCWIFGFICSLMWVVYGIFTHQPPIHLMNTIFMGMNIYGMFKWKQ